jgi:hypothetical protein
MEKIFRPGKWFVLFCGLFVLVWGARQYVSNAVLRDDAQRYAAYVFNWQWAGSDWASQANIVETDVLNHDDNDAVVKVKAHQQFRQHANDQLAVADCSAILKLYKRSTAHGVIWELGEVQFP